ncbi:MAG: hypothetical protein M0042_10220, partial [Nitrospiraceae bacterium]|nr:hypothetical protein [Nitrospiraceae bacterium]
EATAMGVTEVDLYALAMENAGKQTQQFGEIQENSAEKIQKLKALWNDVKEKIGGAIWSVISGIKSLTTGTVDVVMGIMTGAVAGIMGLMMLVQKALNWIGVVKDDTLAKTEADFQKLKNMTKDYFKSAFGKTGESASDEKTPPHDTQTTGNSASDRLEYTTHMKARESAIRQKMAELDVQEMQREVSHVNAAEQRLRLAEELLTVQKENLSLIDDENARAAKQKEIDDTIKNITQLKLALRELNGTLGEGLNEGFKQYIDTARSNFQEGVTLAQETAKSMEQAFSDFFFDAMTGNLKGLGNYVKSFLMSISRAMSDMVARKMVASMIGDMLVEHDGGLIMHSGGYVPRFHVGGLSSDERPAILQTGEYVVSRKGVAALDRINRGDVGSSQNFSVNVINNSGVPLNAEVSRPQFDGEGYIANVILKLVHTNPAIRGVLGIR